MNTIKLSPLDHIFVGPGSYPIEFVFEYDYLLDPESLRAGLAEVLKDFPPVTSRLVRLSEHQYAFQLDSQSPPLEVAESDQSLSDWTQAGRFIESVSTKEGEPLFRAKLTRTPTGSVLGVSFSHALGDGFSFFLFLSCWVNAVRGEPWTRPSHDRGQLTPSVASRLPELTPEWHPRAGFVRDRKRADPNRSHLQWDRHLLSNEAMKELLAEAKEARDIRLSLNAAVSAYLWKTYVPKWGNPFGEPESYLHCPVDFRRVDRTLRKTYFGNAVCLAVATMEFGELERASLGDAAVRIHEAIRSVKPDTVAAALEDLEILKRGGGVEAMEAVHVVHPRSGLLVTNLSRLPLNQLEFGAGAPVGVHILTPAERGAVILPADDGWDIRVYAPATR
jgi:hypothetical protein